MNCRQITTFTVNGNAYPKTCEIPVTKEADEPRHLESGVLNLYPQITFQEIEGFGGAMTESSAYLFLKMDEAVRKAALEEYFGKNGNHTRFVRVHMDSCDFSLKEYAAVEDPIADPELATFSIKRDQKYIIPMLKEAMAISKEPLEVLLSPWSPPAAWKTPPKKQQNDLAVYGALFGFEVEPVDYTKPSRCNGGSLKPEYYGAWAKYLVKFVQAYLDEGIPGDNDVDPERIDRGNELGQLCVDRRRAEDIFTRLFIPGI